MPVPLSRLQKQLVNFDPEGVMLIRGQPGSGKTTVLLERARMLLRAYPRATVLLLAYNEALAARARHHLGDGPAPGRLAVRTLHGWAKALAEHEQVTFTNRFWADSTTRERFLKHILERPPADLAGTRMARWTPQQWSNEVEWLIGQDLQTLEAYLAAPRNGRGRAGSPLRAERDRVWPVFEQYRRELAAKGRHDLEDILGLIGKAAARSGKPLPQKASFDFVLVDEVQDLHLAWLKAVASVARVGTTFAGDFAQRIYRRQFTWKAAGIELPPARSRMLPGSFRNPRAIIELAARVLGQGDGAGNLGYELPDPAGLPADGQEHVFLDQHPLAREARRMALARARALWAGGRDVVVAAPFKRLAEEAVATLTESGAGAVHLQRAELAERSGERVPVTTFHQMKGLECQDIVLLGLEDALYPGWFLQGLDGPEAADKLEELRSLLYMVVTRARETVGLCIGGAACRFL